MAGTPSTVSRFDVALAASTRRNLAFWGSMRRSHRGRLGAFCRVRQHVVQSATGSASGGGSALRLACRLDARCAGPVSASPPLRTRTRASSVPAVSRALARLHNRRCRLFHDRTTRFGGLHGALLSFTAAGVFFPSRCVQAEPLASLSPSRAPPLTLARGEDPRDRQDQLQPARVNEACRGAGPGYLPSNEGPRPASPFEPAGLGPPRCGGLAATTSVVDTVETDAPLRGCSSLTPCSRSVA